MQRAPTLPELLQIALFFFAMNSAFVWLAWRRARRAVGAFRWLYYLPMAPLVVMVSKLCWEWTSDVTAGNLWPLGMAMLAVPCALFWMILMSFEARASRGPHRP